MFKKEFEIAAVYDTETTNMYHGVNSKAFPILFIVNDIRGIDLREYTAENDNIKFFRYETEMLDYINELVQWGKVNNKIPVIAAYNLMFDLQPLMELLVKHYYLKVSAQASTRIYTLDIVDYNEIPLLRFWDTWYLEMNGLKAMGETCGLKKAVGDWDYSLIRTPETNLTETELYYAGRDTQVIPYYLKYLLQSNEWLQQSDFGFKVLTKTSLVRQMAAHKIGNIRYVKDNGKSITQTMMFSKLCYQELPKTFESYAIRKACFRGGLTFTSAKFAGVVVKNVASLDVTSMHHAFINGRYIPVKFCKASKNDLEIAYDYIINHVKDFDIYRSYYKPFDVAFHMQIELDNIKLKKNSVFEKMGIAILASSKFSKKAPIIGDKITDNASNIAAEDNTKLAGYVDKVENGTFAFGKLYKADKIIVYVTEIELFAISKVYEWDGHVCITGEISQKFNKPPDYVTLQSNLLFGMKTDLKIILKQYIEGVPYTGEIPKTIPDGIAEQLKNGTISENFLNNYYTSTVKGQFNSIYGTMAQDIYKPDFEVEKNGEIAINEDTKITTDNWDDEQPDYCKVLYTYGMRIVGGSRLHLILAMELLYKRFGNKIKITGGDTDSLKVACSEDIEDKDLLDALQPLHKAVTDAISHTMSRVREKYTKYASTLDNIGCFEVEKCGNYKRYKYNMDAWNKARVSIDYDNKVHLTCAGLSRPSNLYNMENFIEDMCKKYDVDKILPICLGFNTFVMPQLSHSLETHKPKATDIFNSDVTDYLGNTYHVVAHESNALYPVGRYLGDITKQVNMQSVVYVNNTYNRSLDISEKIMDLDENKNPVIYVNGDIKYKAVKNG